MLEVQDQGVTGLVPLEGLEGRICSRPLSWLVGACLLPASSQSLPSVQVVIPVPSSCYKDTSNTGLGPILMASFNLKYGLVK